MPPKANNQEGSSRNRFRNRVLAIVAQISKGATLTYGEVAKRAGKPQAARAVGSILHTNFDPAIPCHRVVRADGTLGGYNRGSREKKRLLLAEGVKIGSLPKHVV
ncbi:MGMT family protein [Patescibacteria group bacterium]|nr:MAG: MGMT family protein [Patescibacteria group bacterium]